MCSLENFHTCFWEWVGNTYKKDFLKVFIDKDILNENYIDYTAQVHLSDFKSDFEIKLNENNQEKRIIIENKITSFPSDIQLEYYQKEAGPKNNTFILTSLAPKFDIPKPWKYLSYTEIADNMSKIFNKKFKYKNDFHKYLIQDYINVIRYLSKNFPCDKTEKYDFYSKEDLSPVGLRDIYIKWRTSEFANYIKKYINGCYYYVHHSFHNKKGTIDIIKTFTHQSPFDIGIQIEGNQYRYFINTFNDESVEFNQLREELAKELLEKGYWFINTQTPKKSKIYKSFCGYNPGFVYRYFLIDKFFGVDNLEDVSYEQIAEKIYQDIINLDKNIVAILKIVQNINIKVANQMLEKLKTQLHIRKCKTTKLTDYIKKAVKRNDWNIGCFKTKKCIIDIFRTFDNPSFSLGLQIEGNQDRYYLIVLEKKAGKKAREIREKIASELFLNGYWFNNTRATRGNKIYKDFCGYNPDFIYRYFTLEKHYGVDSLKDISYDDIVKQIKIDFENVDNNIDIIKKIISKNL